MYTAAAWDDLEVPQIGSSQLGKMENMFQTTNQLQ